MLPTRRAARERLDMKCPPTVRMVLEAAARVSGESLTAFVLNAALSRAYVHVFDQDLLATAKKELADMRVRWASAPEGDGARK